MIFYRNKGINNNNFKTKYYEKLQHITKDYITKR